MSNGQILIDLNVLNLFMNGTDGDRETIKKLYPVLNVNNFREQLLWDIIIDHAKNPNRTYPVKLHGKMKTLVITELEDDLT